MKKNVQLSHSIILACTSLIWGFAFVAQSEGGDAVGPFTFNAIRFLIGSLVLIPVIKVLDKTGLSERRPKTKADRKLLVTGGTLCGIALCLASCAQQFAITLGVSTGKAGFITACYILLVPILGIFFKKKCGFNIWLGVAFALAGLYCLCITDSFNLDTVDLLLLSCAFLFAVQILLVDKYSPSVDPVRMSCIQFLVCGLLSLIPTFFHDILSAESIGVWLSGFSGKEAWISILYAGVLSSGVAYTLQVVAQPGLNPTVASLLMSFESVFAAIAGWLLLGQHLSAKEIIGCVLMFIAIIIAQLPLDKKRA